MSKHHRRTMNTRRVSRRTTPACVFVSGLALVSLSAGAQELRIVRTDCSKPVHLVARDIPLSMLLRSLSASLHFDVVYHAQSDPLVTADAKSLAPDLVRNLARDMNFSLEEATDPGCAQGRRIARLSVLPDPAGGNRGTVASARPAWQTPEMERIARLGLQDYLQSHGAANQPIEELAVH
jgi:hypothetical protein